MAGGRGLRLLIWTGVPVLAVLLLIAFWSWAWFIPLVERQASAKLGRPVTVGGLGVDLGRVTGITLTDLVVKNPEGFAPAEPPLATVPRLVVQVDVMEFIRHRRIVIPDIAVERPSLRLLADAEGRNNYTFDVAAPEGDTAAPVDPAAEPAIGALRIQDGQAHVTLAKLRADMQLRIGTEEPQGEQPHIRVGAEGRYAGQPITGTLLGGAVLSLRDAANPWPVQLDLANGPTKVSLKGTVQNPLKFAGADLRLELSGPSMALLSPLTGVPVPATPAYRIAGRLDYAESHIRFTGMEGKVGRSDLNGDIRVDPRPARPVVTADLQSRQVDLEDLAGFVGADPGDKPAAARPGRRGRVLPDDPVNLPKLEAADIHLTYKGARILGRAMPLDDLQVKLDIENGAIALHPLRFGVNGGKIEGNFDFTPVARGGLRAKGEIQFQRVDVSRLLGVTNVAEGQGRLGGKAVIDTQGASLAQMLGQGNGSLSLAFTGGNLSSLLVDLSGLRLGNAILSALGLPTRTQVQCFVADMALRRGVLSTRTVLLDTDDALVSGMGDIDLGEEKLNYALRTEAKHFSIGDLPTDIQIRGTFASPTVRPELLELGARGGAAVALGIIALPLALLPTIQFGIGEDNRCENLTRRRR